MTLAELEKNARKAGKSTLFTFTVEKDKNGYTVLLNNHPTGHALTLATAQLVCVIQGGARWQVLEIAKAFEGDPTVSPEWFDSKFFRSRSKLQQMTLDEYQAYLQ